MIINNNSTSILIQNHKIIQLKIVNHNNSTFHFKNKIIHNNHNKKIVNNKSHSNYNLEIKLVETNNNLHLSFQESNYKNRNDNFTF